MADDLAPKAPKAAKANGSTPAKKGKGSAQASA
jgi:hypothetical protein